MTDDELKDAIEYKLNESINIDNVRYNNYLKLYEVDFTSGWNKERSAIVNDDGEVSDRDDDKVEAWKYQVGPCKFRKETFDRQSGEWKSSETLYTNNKTKNIIDTFLRSYSGDIILSEVPGIRENVITEMLPYIMSITCTGTDICQKSEGKLMLNTCWVAMVRLNSTIDKKLLDEYIKDFLLDECYRGIGDEIAQVPITTKDSAPKMFGSYQYGTKTVNTYFYMASPQATCKRV